MSQRLRWYLAAAVVGAIFVTGLFLHGVLGAVLVLVTALILGALSWMLRDQIPSNRLPLRLAVIAVVLAVGVVKLAHS